MLALSLVLPMISNAFAAESASASLGESGASNQSVRSGGQNGYDRGYTGGMAGTGQYVAFGLDVSAWQETGLNFQNFANAGYDQS